MRDAACATSGGVKKKERETKRARAKEKETGSFCLKSRNADAQCSPLLPPLAPLAAPRPPLPPFILPQCTFLRSDLHGDAIPYGSLENLTARVYPSVENSAFVRNRARTGNSFFSFDV